MKSIVEDERFSFERTKQYSTFAMTRQELFHKYLQDLIGLPNLNFLEVGSYEGASAAWTMENILTDPSSSITIVDLGPDERHKLLMENLGKISHLTPTYMFEQSLTALSKLIIRQSLFDFIYIDANHSFQYVTYDALMAFQLLKVGGVIAFDDYNNEKFGVKRAIDVFQDIFDDRVTILNASYQIWFKKIGN